MNHNIGDEIFVKAKIIDIVSNEYEVLLQNSGEDFYCEEEEEEEIYNSSVPATWKNGASERPDGVRAIRLVAGGREVEFSTIYYTMPDIYKQWGDDEFKRMVWMYADKFLVSQNQKPEISNCPSCGGECYAVREMIGSGYENIIYCSGECMYRNTQEEHEKLCNKTRFC